jgi:hypothetical protein
MWFKKHTKPNYKRLAKSYKAKYEDLLEILEHCYHCCFNAIRTECELRTEIATLKKELELIKSELDTYKKI